MLKIMTSLARSYFNVFLKSQSANLFHHVARAKKVDVGLWNLEL